MNLQSLLDFVNAWRTANGITGNAVLTETQQKQFALGLQNKVSEFSVHPERVSWGDYKEGTPMTWSVRRHHTHIVAANDHLFTSKTLPSAA